MNTYYEIQGKIDGDTEVLYGSFSRSDALYELDAERGSWIDQGYSALRVIPRETDESPDPVVYADDDDVDTTPDPVNPKGFKAVVRKPEVHFFASCVFGWASATTRDEAIEKLVNSFRSDYKGIVKNSQKNGSPGAYVWTCQVNAPADAQYSIEYYAPRGIDTQDGQEHAVTYLTDKAIAHCRTYEQEVKNLRHELDELQKPVDSETAIRETIEDGIKS